MTTPNLARRNFLLGSKVSKLRPFRLPWSISESIFITHCNRCGDCSTACESGIIVKGDCGYPTIDFSKGKCTFCGSCVTACPQPLFIDDKTQPAWSVQLTIDDKCLAKNQIYCQSCRDDCEQNAIQFKYLESSIPRPVVDNDLCNGCGACISVCPQQSTRLSLSQEQATE